MPNYKFSSNQETDLDFLENTENGSGLTVTRQGGELVSYRIVKPNGKEVVPLLYRDGQADKPESGWKNHATILFPIVGGINNGESTYKGGAKIKSASNHGFARRSKWELAGADTNGPGAKITYSLKPNKVTRDEFPFEFEFLMTYELKENVLTVIQTVKNCETEKIMPCQLGWHPGFGAPVLPGKGNRSDIQLLMNPGTYTKLKCNQESRLTGEREDVVVENAYPWNDQDLSDTIMLDITNPENRTVTMSDPNSKINIKVDFADYPQLGFWAEKDTPFICIEPWQGVDDHENQEPFEKKVGVIFLEPGKSRSYKATVTPEFL